MISPAHLTQGGSAWSGCGSGCGSDAILGGKVGVDTTQWQFESCNSS